MKLLTSTVIVAIVFASQAAAAFDRDGTSFGERYVARNCAWFQPFGAGVLHRAKIGRPTGALHRGSDTGFQIA